MSTVSRPGRAETAAERASRWVRPEVAALDAYRVADASGLVKLDAMENPFPWPGALRDAWLQSLRAIDLNRYPDAAARELRRDLARWLALPPGLDVMIGNGSDELIQLVLLAVGGAGRSAMAPVPTFVMYEHLSRVTGTAFEGVPLSVDLGLDLPAFERAIGRRQPAVLFVAQPNNPTAALFDPADLDRLMSISDGLVIIDEAYHPYSGVSVLGSLADRPNALVMRTLSKVGLAGLRLGMLIGPAAWLAELEKVRLPYNVGTVAQATARFALDHAGLLVGQARAIVAERERVLTALSAMPGVSPYPSHANFVLLRLGQADPDAVHEALRRRGVLVKNVHRPGGPLAGCLRVTIGLANENDAFLAALEQSLRETAQG